MAYQAENEILTQDVIRKLQADIVSIDTATNPAIKKINSNFNPSKKYILTTSLTKITPAINALSKVQNDLKVSLNKSVNSVFDFVGNVSSDIELRNKFEEYIKSHTSVTDITIINIIMEIIDRLSVVEKFSADDYEDEFEVGENETMSVFSLTHKPIGKVRFFIDGVRYFSNYYEYKPEDNTVVWLGTVSNMGNDKGFDISDSTVVIEYDYDKTAEEADTETDEPAA